MKQLIQLILATLAVSIFTNCTNDETETNNKNLTVGNINIEQYRKYFEKNAPGLSPVDFSYVTLDDIVAKQRSDVLKSANLIFNIVPEWKDGRTFISGSRKILEIPLTGDTYNMATLTAQSKVIGSDEGLKLQTHLYPSQSFLIIEEDTIKKRIRYYVINFIPDSEDGALTTVFGNNNSKGFVIYSDVKGRYLESYHVSNGKWHPITINPMEQIERSEVSREFTLLALNHVNKKQTNSYSSSENGGDGGFGTGASYVCCAICEMFYFTDLGECPNKCKIEVSGSGNSGWGTFPLDLNWGGGSDSGGDPNSGLDGGGSGIGGGSGSVVSPTRTPTISLSCGTQIKLGTDYTITATSNSGKIITTCSFIMQELGVNPEYYLSYHGANPCATRAYRPGKYKLWALVDFSIGGAEYSNVLDIEIQYPDHTEITANPTVAAYMEKAWNETKTPEANALYAERGFAIYFDTESNTYSFGNDRAGLDWRDPCTAELMVANIPLDYYQTGDPRVGGISLVGIFHTHPPYMCTSGHRRVGPSSIDTESHTEDVAFVYDYIGEDGYLQYNHKINDPAKIYHYGLNRAK